MDHTDWTVQMWQYINNNPQIKIGLWSTKDTKNMEDWLEGKDKDLIQNLKANAFHEEEGTKHLNAQNFLIGYV